MKDWFKKAREWVWLEGDPSRDRAFGLKVSGVLEIVLGFLSFSLAMLLLIVVASTGFGGMKPVHFWMSMGFLFYLTGWFIVMGLGSFKARRWARALVLVGAWVTVFFGTLVLALVFYILPEMYALLSDAGILSPMVTVGLLYYAALVLVLLQVVFPLVAVAFYSMKGVQGTCERLNPEASWTDRYSLPLLAMGFVSGLGCLSVFVGATMNYVVFLFGDVVSGWPGLFVVLMVSAGFGYIGWGAFTRDVRAWWGAYALVLLAASSMMLTVSKMDMKELYGHMGYTAEQVVKLEAFHPFDPAMLTFVSCVWAIMACVFLVWVRDCFLPEQNQAEVKAYQPEKEADQPAVSTRPRMRLDD